MLLFSYAFRSVKAVAIDTPMDLENRKLIHTPPVT